MHNTKVKKKKIFPTSGLLTAVMLVVSVNFFVFLIMKPSFWCDPFDEFTPIIHARKRLPTIVCNGGGSRRYVRNPRLLEYLISENTFVFDVRFIFEKRCYTLSRWEPARN